MARRRGLDLHRIITIGETVPVSVGGILVAMLVADRILSAAGKHTVAPTIAPIKVPKVIVLRNQVLDPFDTTGNGRRRVIIAMVALNQDALRWDARPEHGVPGNGGMNGKVAT